MHNALISHYIVTIRITECIQICKASARVLQGFCRAISSSRLLGLARNWQCLCKFCLKEDGLLTDFSSWLARLSRIGLAFGPCFGWPRTSVTLNNHNHNSLCFALKQSAWYRSIFTVRHRVLQLVSTVRQTRLTRPVHSVQIQPHLAGGFSKFSSGMLVHVKSRLRDIAVRILNDSYPVTRV